MPPDCYKVEVLFCFNPHLIWVEVRDPIIAQDGYKFEQIGIYGVLPLETTIDLDDEEITVQKSKKWLPAATTLMKNFWGRKDVWFIPTHIDRRSSIFDDNVHTFGDLIIKTSDGRSKSLSKMLRTSGFATYDACLFHQYLSEGRIITKLDSAATQEVVQQLEKYYRNNNEPAKYWDTPVKIHTSVSRASLDIEGALTTTNFSRHDKLVKTLLENKRKDLELCKGVDERSVGRGTTRKINNKKELTPVEKKLELLNAKKKKCVPESPDDLGTQNQQNTSEETESFLDTPSYPEKISNRTDAHKAQILKKIMCKTGKKISKQEQLVKRLLNESRRKSDSKQRLFETPDKSSSPSLLSSQFEVYSSEKSSSNDKDISKEVAKEVQQSNSESLQGMSAKLDKSDICTSTPEQKSPTKVTNEIVQSNLISTRDNLIKPNKTETCNSTSDYNEILEKDANQVQQSNCSSFQEILVKPGKSDKHTSDDNEITKNNMSEIKQLNIVTDTEEPAANVKAVTSTNTATASEIEKVPKKPSNLIAKHEKFLNLGKSETSTSTVKYKENPTSTNEIAQVNSVSVKEKSLEVGTEVSNSKAEKKEIPKKNVLDIKQSSSASINGSVVKGAQPKPSTSIAGKKETSKDGTNEKIQAKSISDEGHLVKSAKLESSSSKPNHTVKNEVLQCKSSSSSKSKIAKKDLKAEVKTSPVQQSKSQQCDGVKADSTRTNQLKNKTLITTTQEKKVDPDESILTTDEMASSIINKHKLEGSKHGNIIKKALAKYPDVGKPKETFDVLSKYKRKSNHEIKELKKKHKAQSTGSDKKVPPAPKQKKSKKKGKKGNVKKGTKTAFGPPGIDLTKLNCRVPPIHLYDEENLTGQNGEGSSKRNNGDADSTTSVEVNDKDSIPSCSYENKHTRHRSDRKDTTSSSSSLWEKRLKLHKEMAKNKRCASHTSETVNKDTSNQEDKIPPKNFKPTTEDDTTDESISEVMEALNSSENTNTLAADTGKEIVNTCSEVAVNANPFQNFDSNMSVFVDNLVTPIMMVHSKMNKRFVPTCLYRDINFSDHIRSVLRNMHICRPMMLQTITWSSILRGYSVFMIGSASSGKTMGYLPAVCRLVTDSSEAGSDGDSVGPISIIVCATSQSVSEIERIAKMLVGCSEKVVSCYFGHDETAIATTLLNGCDLLISTAPSLVRLLQVSDFGVDLRRLASFVLDDCERLSEVYLNELKFCLFKVKDMLKARANKELKVQYIVASRIWCEFMEPLAKKAPDTVVCIGAFQECVLYARANMTVSYVKKEKKLKLLMEFLEDIDSSKRTVVVCDSDDEVDFLNRSIQAAKYFVFASNSKMTVQDLYNLSILWREFKEPMTAPVLICRDSNLYHMNIVNAHYLVQYSMPSLYSTFCRRFATLNESYPSIFKTDNQAVKILILLEDGNVEQFPKIINFVKRCRNNIPEFIDGICATVIAKNDAKKAESLSPLCNTFLSLGDCPDLYNCRSRHTIHKDYDKPKEWMPTSGVVTFKILHYHTATQYSARLIANFDIGTYLKYPPAYINISMKLGVHFSSPKNRILLGIPKVGDICAVSLSSHLFVRCQVIRILNKYERGNPKNVLINMIDEELIDTTTDTNLYYLPDDLKDLDTYVVHIRLANVQPRDKDIVFSELARNQLKKSIVENDNIYMKGQIALTVGNCIFVDTLEACQDLKSLNETVVICNVKRELLEKHAEVNPEHITKLAEFCRSAGLEIKSVENTENEIAKSRKDVPFINWAYLDRDMTTVYFGCAEDPDTFFVRLTKFENCMKILIQDIQKYVASNTTKIEKFQKDDIVLAEYPDDLIFRRARIDDINDAKIKCFFVDQGEWLWLTKEKLMPIEDSLINQMPFQAIECRLVGVKPPGDTWTNFSINWLFDKCFESNYGGLKQLFVKYFTKESAQFTGGHKYGVVLIDTYGDDDIVINQVMINLNLAKVAEDEVKYLDFIKPKVEAEVESNDEDEEEEDEDWERVSKYSANSNSSARTLPVSNILLSRPIRSVPLVGSEDDCDDLDRWHVNMCDDLVDIFKPVYDSVTHDGQPHLPAIANAKFNDGSEPIDLACIANNIDKVPRHFQLVTVNPNATNELDSDDLSSPEPSLSPTYMEKAQPIKQPTVAQCQLRKPNLNWRQTQTSVMMKIHLIGVETYDMEICDREIKFAATVNDTNYGFELELYGVIDKKTASHSNKGQYILVKFNKLLPRNWLTLTKDGGIRKWIVYDVDSIDTSSDEEDVQDDNLVNIIRNMHDQVGSDTEDDEFEDDVNFRYKND